MASVVSSNSRFQSTPLTEARGDPASPVNSTAAPVFQSTPLTEARGDLSATALPRCVRCFNPLP